MCPDGGTVYTLVLGTSAEGLGFLYIAEIDDDLGKHIINYFPASKNFMNKLAIVMSISERQDKITAIYRHDFQYWIIQKTF